MQGTLNIKAGIEKLDFKPTRIMTIIETKTNKHIVNKMTKIQ